MKSKIVFICLLFVPLILSQEKQEEIKESVKDFFNTVKNYTQGFNTSNKEEFLETNKYSDEELKSLLYKYYKAKAEDPMGFYKYQENEDNVSKEQLEKSMGSDLSLAKKVGVIYRILSSKYGKSYMDIISHPYYMKIKILDIQQRKFETDKGPVPRTILYAQIENVVKGKKFFNEEDKIEINYLNWWMRNAHQKFNINKNYFVALRPWDCYSGNCNKYAISMFSDGNHGIYPIENNNIITQGNFFQFGETSKWADFRNQFEEKYILIED